MPDLNTTSGSESAAQPAQAPEASQGGNAPLLDAAAPSGEGGTLLGGSEADGTADSADHETQSEAAPPAAGATQQEKRVLPEGLHPLPDDATDDQREAFEGKLRALNGVPDDPMGYGDFGYGEAVDKTSEEYRHYTDAFHAAGLSPRQAKLLLDKHIEWSKGQAEHITRQQDAVINEYRSKVRKDFIRGLGGEQAFAQFSETARRGFKASAQGAGLSPEESTGLLAIIGDDPRFMKVFNHIGGMHREDVLVTGAKPKAAEVSMDELIAQQFNK